MYVALMDLFSRNPPPLPLPQVVHDLVMFTPPIILSALLRHVSQPNPSKGEREGEGKRREGGKGALIPPHMAISPLPCSQSPHNPPQRRRPRPCPVDIITRAHFNSLLTFISPSTPGHNRRRLDRARLCHVSLGRGGEPDGQPVLPLAVPHEPALQGAVQGGTGEGSRAAVPVATPALISVPFPPSPPSVVHTSPPPLSTPSPPLTDSPSCRPIPPRAALPPSAPVTL